MLEEQLEALALDHDRLASVYRITGRRELAEIEQAKACGVREAMNALRRIYLHDESADKVVAQ